MVGTLVQLVKLFSQLCDWISILTFIAVSGEFVHYPCACVDSPQVLQFLSTIQVGYFKAFPRVQVLWGQNLGGVDALVRRGLISD